MQTSNYSKGLSDGYHIAQLNRLPAVGPNGGGEDTAEYKLGLADGKALYQIEENKKHYS